MVQFAPEASKWRGRRKRANERERRLYRAGRGFDPDMVPELSTDGRPDPHPSTRPAVQH